MPLSSYFKSSIAVASLITVLAAPVARAQQAPPTVGVVSVASLEQAMGSIKYVINASNFREFGAIFTMSARQFTQGIDPTKPIGAIVKLDGQMPSATVFLPMDDSELFFNSLATVGIEPDEIGDGMYEIDTGGQLIFAKQQGDWMFIGQTEDELASLPADPASELGNLPDRYDIALRVNVAEVPQGLKEAAMEQIRMGFENAAAGGQEVDAAAEAQLEQMELLMSDTDQIIVGWKAEEDNQRTFLDGGALFIPGSELAKQVEASQGATSKYAKFILPEASAKARFTTLIAEGDREAAKLNMQNSMQSVVGQAAQNLPEEGVAVLEELLAGLGMILEDTIDEGIFDGAGSVSVADDELKILVGGRVADGEALAAELKKLAAQKPEGQEPTFEFDYATYKDVTLHKVYGPMDGDDAMVEIFGDTLTIVIGTHEKGFLIAVADDSEQLAKQAIDGLQGIQEVEASPFEMVVKVADFLNFSQSISPNPMLEAAVDTISEYAGKDKIEVNGRLLERGGVYRLSIEEGVLRTIGAAARGDAGGGGF